MDNRELRKLLLFHNLINSPNDRVAKMILKEQIDNEIEKCWCSEIVKIKDMYEIELQQATRREKYQRINGESILQQPSARNRKENLKKKEQNRDL